MKKIVLKFGGTSLMDTRRIQNAAEIVEHVAAEGYEIVVVVSAMGHTTDYLLELAKDIEKTPNGRERDALMSTGELISASLMAVALQSKGFSAKSFTGSEAGIFTNSKFGAAIGAQLSSSYEVSIMQLLTKHEIAIAMIYAQDRQLSIMIPTECIEKAIDLTHQNYCPLKLAS